MKTLSKIISIIFHPILVPTLFCLLLLNAESFISLLPVQIKLMIGVSIFATTFVVPLLFLPILKYYGQITSYELENRSERIVPMLITCLCYGLCFFELLRLPFPVPSVFLHSLMGAAIALLCCLCISMKWKISAHTTGMGGLLASVFCFALKYGAFVDLWLALSIVAAGLTFSARLYLQAHTLGQAVAGFLLGFAAVGLGFLLI